MKEIFFRIEDEEYDLLSEIVNAFMDSWRGDPDFDAYIDAFLPLSLGLEYPDHDTVDDDYLYDNSYEDWHIWVYLSRDLDNHISVDIPTNCWVKISIETYFELKMLLLDERGGEMFSFRVDPGEVFVMDFSQHEDDIQEQIDHIQDYELFNAISAVAARLGFHIPSRS